MAGDGRRVWVLAPYVSLVMPGAQDGVTVRMRQECRRLRFRSCAGATEASGIRRLVVHGDAIRHKSASAGPLDATAGAAAVRWLLAIVARGGRTPSALVRRTASQAPALSSVTVGDATSGRSPHFAGRGWPTPATVPEHRSVPGRQPRAVGWFAPVRRAIARRYRRQARSWAGDVTLPGSKDRALMNIKCRQK